MLYFVHISDRSNISVNNPKNFNNELENSKTNKDHRSNENGINKGILYESEGLEDNSEVDPKSNLANKTIFKTDNPNLSIIEINNDNSIKSEEENVYLIGSDDDEEHKEKVRSILDSSKQKLNVTISTSSLTSTVTSTATIASSGTTSTDNTKKSPEKRTIKIYDTIEEFENNLPQTVKILSTPFGSKVYLVGTAHFSEESQDDVSFVCILKSNLVILFFNIIY